MEKRKKWIDSLRGLCMIAILLLHTDIYYVDNGTLDGIISYNLYVVDAIVIFFFLSGYLMYKETAFNLKNKAISVLRTIVLPYFIFTSLLYIPKNIVYGNGIDIAEMAREIVTGQASWFVATLALSELIFSFVLYVSKRKTPYIAATAVIGFALSVFMSENHAVYFWQADNAFQALLFLAAGYLFHKYEERIDCCFRKQYLVVLFLIIVGIKYIVMTYGISLIIWKIDISCYPLFIADITVCTLMAVQLFKRLPGCRLLEWTGSHSLVYYFFCGGVPLVTGKILRHFNFVYNGNYLNVIIALIMVYVITSAIVWTIYRFLPFTVGIWGGNKKIERH